MSAVSKPEQMASVILVRDAQPRGVEVFLTRRPEGLPVVGGKYSFPGGTVHKSDHGPNMLRRCRGLSGERARKIIGAHFAPPEALGYWIAAARVLFKEVGILIAAKENGEPTTLDAELVLRLLEERAAPRGGALDFPALMERENLFCDAARLVYFSHWQTTGESSCSFDTRVFLAAMAEQQAPRGASCEVSHGSWLAPDRALQFFKRGELPVAFATFASLRTLADFDDVKGLFQEFQRQPA